MDNDLKVYDDNTKLAGYLATLQGEDAELAELRADTNPFEVMPRLTLSKDTREIKAVLNGETEATFGSRNQLFFVPLLVCGRRALWRPEGSDNPNIEGEDKQPVCSTPHVTVNTFRRDNDTGVGTWRAKDNRDLPSPNGEDWDPDLAPEENVSVKCASCKWNLFSTMQNWDPTRSSSRGKACSEGRLLVGAVCEKMKDLPNGLALFDFNPNGPFVYMNVPSTSIKTVKQIGTACVARNTPARYVVFNLGNDPQSSGSQSWGVLTQQLSGFLVPNRIGDSNRESSSLRELVLGKDIDTESNVNESPVEEGEILKGKNSDPTYGF